MGTLWTNGKIYTMQSEGHMVEAVYTENGTIRELGSVEEIRNKYTIEETIDLHNRVMFPGFVDSHMHLIGHGETLLRLDLSQMKSKKEVLDAVAEKAEILPEGQWIFGEGWNENLWDDAEVISKHELDSVVPNHPVLLKRICRHAMVVNSLALKEANISERTPHPVGGLIEKDDEGRLNGLLKDKAQDLMTEALPAISSSYLEAALSKGIESCWENGLVGGHTEDLSYYGNFNKTYNAFKQTINNDNKKFRAHLLVHHEVINDWHEEGHQFLGGNDFIEFGAMKIFADGALGGRTALLSYPYADDPGTKGVSIHSQENLLELVEKARSLQLPIAVHTIGDQAFENVVDAINVHPSKQLRRDRLIHAQILREELIEKIKGLPLILDIQPRFVPSDFPWVIDRLGEENMKYNYAWKTLLERGIHCAGGSDAPIEPVNPLWGIHAAVTRTNPMDREKTVYMPEERLSMFEAISLFTRGSAYACHHEDDRGMIKEGYTADFTVLEKDPFTSDPDELLEKIVSLTVVDDTIVYSKK
ncbi:amidohydrolase [Rossellomorea aquimaris]|uniref:amidohydrolase n=1 Tax=Rossellomorea aquimaris TaxID=189382 RepID=UPI001CD25C04|nr:amidohydrolase [Rossellomorea aquimaris]MCA1056898.1 amidohydrolase [Rossellomorea aquimaris]